MSKKLSLLLAAAVLFAFAAPAFASAATGLTEGGALVLTAKPIKATNVGAFTTTSNQIGGIACQSAVVKSTLAVNKASEVKLVSGTGSATSCTGGSVKELTFSEIKTTGGGTGTFAVVYTVVLPSTAECHFSTSAGTFTYFLTETAEGGDVITISEQTLAVLPKACGTTAKLDGKFTLTTEAGTPTFLM